MRRGLALLAALVLLAGCVAWEAAAEENVRVGRTEPLYSQARAGYTLPVYGKEPVRFETALDLTVGDAAQVDLTVPEDGQYEIWLTYQNTTRSTLPTELTVRVDGALPFYELRRVKLQSLWVTEEGPVPVDRYGNEIAPTPVPAQTEQTVGITDSAARTDLPFLFELTAGSHTLTLECLDSGASVSAVTLKAPAALPAYRGEKAQGSAMIVIEGEDISSRSRSSIRAAGEFNAVLTPYSIEHRVLNHLDGASFDTAGDTVTYAFKAETEGWYNLVFHYRQSVKADFPVFLDVLIDGELPSEAARQIHMDYTTSFTDMTAMHEGAPETFYLTAGAHTLSLRINAAPLTPVYEMIDRVLSEINTLSLEITRLSGGKADQYRSYNVREYIPDVEERLNGWSRDCADAVEYVSRFSSIGSGSAFSSLTLCADQLRRLA